MEESDLTSRYDAAFSWTTESFGDRETSPCCVVHIFDRPESSGRVYIGIYIGDVSLSVDQGNGRINQITSLVLACG